MSYTLPFILHPIATDGLPDVPALMAAHRDVAFIFDGCVVSGWPLDPASEDYPYDPDEYDGILWEANTDVGNNQPKAGVTHWIEFLTTPAAMVRGFES